MEQSLVRTILAHARFAPSGDNLQPWRFREIDSYTLELYFHPSPVPEPHFFFTGNYTNIGIMLEYVVLIAEELGYHAEVTLERDAYPKVRPLVATFRFIQNKTPREKSSLISAIQTRTTLRDGYETTPLKPEDVASLTQSSAVHGATLTWRSDTEARKEAARALGASDRYFWSLRAATHTLKESVYRKTRRSTRTFGMPARTLGVGPLEHFIPLAFSIADRVPLLWNPIGHITTLATTLDIMHSGAVCFLSVPTTTPKKLIDPAWSGADLISGGRASARLWLTATERGLVLQPLYPFVAMVAHEGNTECGEKFTRANERVTSYLRSVLPHYNTETLAFAFRIGYPKGGSMPTPEAPRLSVDELLS